MSSDVLRRAAAKLRDPYLRSFPFDLAPLIADWLNATDFEAGAETGTNPEALIVALAVLREDS